MLEYLERLDHTLFFAINNGLSVSPLAPVLDRVFWLLATLGNGTGMLCWTLIGLWFFDRRALKTHWTWLILNVIIGAVIAQALKYGIARPRPLTAFAPLLATEEQMIYVVGEALQYRSFPSGHAQATASVLIYLCCLYPRYAVWWGLGIVLAGLGRIYVGAHFPADVLAGTCLGCLSALATVALQRRWAQRHGAEIAPISTR